jgi:hypothetical protein
MQAPQAENLWTHLELVGAIVFPVAGGLWAFFNKLSDHSKSDTENFGKIDTGLATLNGKMDAHAARVETKIDAMWRDWTNTNGGTK